MEGGIYTFFLGSFFCPFSFFCFGMTRTSGGGADTAALRAFFFRVPEVAEDFWFFGIVDKEAYIYESIRAARRSVQH